LPTFGCEWLRSMTKADFLHIPYKGNAPALNDLMGGQVNILIDLFNTALPQIRAGSVRPVALTRASRGQPLPELPVIAETLPGFVSSAGTASWRPPAPPAPIVERLNAAFNKALANEEVKKRINRELPRGDAEHTRRLRQGAAGGLREVRPDRQGSRHQAAMTKSGQTAAPSR
jgi:tripartite-type tricarboxylate transporter receptor subunit TctC